MIPRLALSLLTAAILSLSSTFASAQEQQALEQRGKALLTSNCSRCHAIGTAGNSPHREAPPFRTLSRRYPIESLAEALGEGLITGHPDMPEFRFEVEDVSAILAYLESIQEPGTPRPSNRVVK